MKMEVPKTLTILFSFWISHEWLTHFPLLSFYGFIFISPTFTIGAHQFQNTKAPEIYKHFPTAATSRRPHTQTHTLRTTRPTLRHNYEISPSISASPRSSVCQCSAFCSAGCRHQRCVRSVGRPKHICPPLLALDCRDPPALKDPLSASGQTAHANMILEIKSAAHKKREIVQWNIQEAVLRISCSRRGLLHNAAIRFSKTWCCVFVKQLKTDKNIKHGWINPC